MGLQVIGWYNCNPMGYENKWAIELLMGCEGCNFYFDGGSNLQSPFH